MATQLRQGRNPDLAPEGAEAVTSYGHYLREHEDLSAPTLRNYLSEIRHFAAWYEATHMEGLAEGTGFDPASVTTPAITAYRSWMQREARIKLATINRRLVTLNRHFAWAMEQGLILRDPAKSVKQVPVVEAPPRHLSDKGESSVAPPIGATGPGLGEPTRSPRCAAQGPGHLDPALPGLTAAPGYGWTIASTLNPCFVTEASVRSRTLPTVVPMTGLV